MDAGGTRNGRIHKWWVKNLHSFNLVLECTSRCRLSLLGGIHYETYVRIATNWNCDLPPLVCVASQENGTIQATRQLFRTSCWHCCRINAALQRSQCDALVSLLHDSELIQNAAPESWQIVIDGKELTDSGWTFGNGPAPAGGRNACNRSILSVQQGIAHRWVLPWGLGTQN